MTHNDQNKTPIFENLLSSSPDAQYYRHQTRNWGTEQKRSAEEMAAALHRAGCGDPLPWIYSELQEALPQRARFAFLRELHLLALGTPELLEDMAVDDERLSNLFKVITATLNSGDLTYLVRRLTQQVCREVTLLLDAGRASNLPPIELPGWQLMEMSASNELTGRLISGLHEDIDGFALRHETTFTPPD